MAAGLLSSSAFLMSEVRAASLAFDRPLSLDDVRAAAPLSAPSDRRAHSRLTPAEFNSRLTARHKYGESVTVVDLSAGGVLLETSRIIRPDTDLALEIHDAQTREVSQVVSRVLRARVAGVSGGITYRAACAFKRPLPHQFLLEASVPAPAAPLDTHDYIRLELALKTIVEGYFKRPSTAGSAGRWRDATSLIQALIRLRAAAERRRDPVDRHLGDFLANLIPALQRHEPVEALLAQLQDQLSQYLPVLAIRANTDGALAAHDRERLTLNMCSESGRPPVAVTAEFAPGFSLDAGQLRLLKLTAYLVGLAGNWTQSARQDGIAKAAAQEPPHAPAVVEPATDAPPMDSGELPFPWQRIVVRYADGQVLRGYSSDFHPENAHLHLSPSIQCAAADRLLVPLGKLKAIFFVKDLQGNKERVDEQAFDHAPRGRKLKVTFRDGEVIVGSTLTFKPNGNGFFLHPANRQGNNIRIYVLTTAIRHTRFV